MACTARTERGATTPPLHHATTQREVHHEVRSTAGHCHVRNQLHARRSLPMSACSQVAGEVRICASECVCTRVDACGTQPSSLTPQLNTGGSAGFTQDCTPMNALLMTVYTGESAGFTQDCTPMNALLMTVYDRAAAHPSHATMPLKDWPGMRLHTHEEAYQQFGMCARVCARVGCVSVSVCVCSKTASRAPSTRARRVRALRFQATGACVCECGRMC